MIHQNIAVLENRTDWHGFFNRRILQAVCDVEMIDLLVPISYTFLSQHVFM